MSATLIIGYGNLLRGDDAVGCHAAHELEENFRDDPEVEIIAAQQLTPEMAEDISRSQFIIFIDASYGNEPGMIQATQVRPEHGPSGFTHQLTPSSLLSAAAQLYGDCPEGVCLTLSGWSFDVSNKLSRGAQLRLPQLVRQARQLVELHRDPKFSADEVLHVR